MKKDRLPDEIPDEGGSVVIKEEKDYEIIVEWVPRGCTLSLYVRPHEDYPEIVPDEVNDCDLHDVPTQASTIKEMPPSIPTTTQ